MKIKNMKLEEIRKKYAKEESEFVIRIRKQGKDIIYYNGIKAFEIVKNREEISNIIIADNVYNFNRTNIQRCDKDEKKIKNAIKEMRKRLNQYFPKILASITLEISVKSYEKIINRDKSRKDFEYSIDRIRKIVNEKYEQYIEVEKLDFNKIEKELDKQYNENLASNKYLKNLKYDILLRDFADRDEKYMEDIVDIEYEFIKCFIFDKNGRYRQLFKIPKFSYTKNSEDIVIEKEEYEKFEEAIKQAIEDYEKHTKIELEKKYQHLFMKSKLLKDKYEILEGIYRFEEEYYTHEKSKKDKGRMDCIFVKINENTSSAELYLIELKVDAEVIGGTNGVNKHLIDIEKLKRSKEDFENFVTLLEQRIKYRRHILVNANKDIKIDRQKVHFWIVIAISGEEKVKEVSEMLYEKLEDFEYIKDKKNKLPKGSVVLSQQIKQLEKEEIDVKILFDKWDYKSNANKLSEVKLLEIPEFENITSKERITRKKEALLELWKNEI